MLITHHVAFSGLRTFAISRNRAIGALVFILSLSTMADNLVSRLRISLNLEEVLIRVVVSYHEVGSS